MNPAAVKHSESLLVAWRLAELEAANLRHEQLEPEHFFLGLLKLAELDVNAILTDNTALSDSRIRQEMIYVERLRTCFKKADLETTSIRRRLRRVLPRGTTRALLGQSIRRSATSREVFAAAEQSTRKSAQPVLEPFHLLRALVATECPWILKALDFAGVDAKGLAEISSDVLLTPAEKTLDESEERGNRRNDLSDPMKGVEMGIVDRLGRDLTELAKVGKLPPVIGRRAEMRSLVQTLLRSRKNNAILIGEAGVGKTGIVEGLAQWIAEGGVPPEFVGKRIVEISMGDLVAGTSLRGDMEERLQTLIAQSKRDSDLILFIDEIHLLVGAGKGSGAAMDAANMLKPALARGEIRVVGATTTQEYREFIETDAALARRFETIEVSEPSRSETLDILAGIRGRIEEHHGIKIGEEALEAAVDLTVRYLPMHRLPDKAIDVLDQACAQARMQSLSGDFRANFKAGLLIQGKHVAAAVAHRCRFPVGDIVPDEAELLLRLESELEKRVKGQSQAILAVSQAIRLARSGLKDSETPVGVFLFAGPSGTGKTELAKSLSAVMFGCEFKLIRIDMSEFMDAHSVSKLIGAPPGFIGHEDGGQLTEQFRSRPHCVLLLDEVEKAHPKIFDLFLQVFDNGFLTDAHGVRCDFRETIIIMTSNIGTSKSNATLGFDVGATGLGSRSMLADSISAGVRQFFRPEFINRITEVVVFQPLGYSEVDAILTIILNRINQRLAPKQIKIGIQGEARALLIQRGYSEEDGARHLERIVEQAVSKPLSELILAGKAAPGSSVFIRAKGEEIELEIVEHLQREFDTQ